MAVSPARWLLLYAVAVVAVTFIHQPPFLGLLLMLAVGLAGPGRWRLLRRALLAMLAFNLTVSAGVVLIGLWQGRVDTAYLLLVNLRVLLLVFLGFWFVARVDVLAALAGWPTLRLVATLALGQIRTLERIVADCRLAFASRNIVRPGLADRARHGAAQGITLMDKSVAAATESSLAMKSRGAFDA